MEISPEHHSGQKEHPHAHSQVRPWVILQQHLQDPDVAGQLGQCLLQLCRATTIVHAVAAQYNLRLTGGPGHRAAGHPGLPTLPPRPEQPLNNNDHRLPFTVMATIPIFQAENIKPVPSVAPFSHYVTLCLTKENPRDPLKTSYRYTRRHHLLKGC